MVSDITSTASLIQQAPALAVAVCALLFAAWSFRAHRKALAQAEDRQGVSNVRQGRRLGRLEKAVTLLDMRRQITEEELRGAGIRLSFWPPDGPDQYPDDDVDEELDDRAGPTTAHLETQHFVSPRPTSRRTS